MRETKIRLDSVIIVNMASFIFTDDRTQGWQDTRLKYIRSTTAAGVIRTIFSYLCSLLLSVLIASVWNVVGFCMKCLHTQISFYIVLIHAQVSLDLPHLHLAGSFPLHVALLQSSSQNISGTSSPFPYSHVLSTWRFQEMNGEGKPPNSGQLTCLFLSILLPIS